MTRSRTQKTRSRTNRFASGHARVRRVAGSASHCRPRLRASSRAHLRGHARAAHARATLPVGSHEPTDPDNIHVTKSPGAVLTPAVHAHAPPLSTVLT